MIYIIVIIIIIIFGKIFQLARKILTRLLFLVKQKSFLSNLNPVSKTDIPMTAFICAYFLNVLICCIVFFGVANICIIRFSQLGEEKTSLFSLYRHLKIIVKV